MILTKSPGFQNSQYQIKMANALVENTAKLQLDEETGEMVSKSELKKRMQKRAKKAAAAAAQAAAAPAASAAKTPRPN